MNVAILGCGMAVCGIWCKQILIDSFVRNNNNNNNSSKRVNVYEFDAWGNCLLKQQALMNSGIIHESFMNVSVHVNVVEKTLLGCPVLDTLFRTISKETIVADNDVSGYDHNIKEKEEEEYYICFPWTYKKC